MLSFLQGLYRHYNRLYFKNKLPPCKVHYTDEPFSTYAWFDYDFDSKGKAIGLKIYIRRRFKKYEDLAAQFLLHEMIHVELRDDPGEKRRDPNYHSPKFKKRLKQLIRAGAFDNLL